MDRQEELAAELCSIARDRICRKHPYLATALERLKICADDGVETAAADGEAPKKTSRKKAAPATEEGEAPKKTTRKRAPKAESTEAAPAEKKPRTRKKAEPKPEEKPAE